MPAYPQETKQAAALFDQGYKIERSDLATAVWPQAAFNLFTISGGWILVKRLMQRITVAACDAVATTVKFSITTAAPFAAATVDFTAASGSLSGVAIGGGVQMVGTALSTAALVFSTIGPSLQAVAAPIVLTPGIVSVTSAGAAMTGLAVIITSMWYVPLDDAAVVVTS